MSLPRATPECQTPAILSDRGRFTSSAGSFLGDQGWSTPLTTWITPFDCITLAVVTVAVLPLASVT